MILSLLHRRLRYALASLVQIFAAFLMPGAAAAQSAGSEWTTPAGTVQGTRFSALTQINAGNVSQLHEEFRFKTGVLAGHEGAPLVVGTTMYVVGPFPNKLFALDLKRPGETRWVFDPRADRFAQDKACCDIVNRGAVFANGKVIYNVLDNTTVAVDAVTGREVWRKKFADPAKGQTMTMAPLLVHDKVLVGNSGGEMGVRGFIAALDVKTGAEVWRAFSTGPDKDVLIGSRFVPFYDKDKGPNLGATTWPGTLWDHGGGTVWGWLSYDPDLNLLYHGTANPGVWNADLRPGDNKWSTTVFARDPDTGEAIWAYQITPHDGWDYDGVNENIVVDLPFPSTNSATRKLLVRFDRNGFAYTMDRKNGQVLSAQKYVFANWADHVDLSSGLPIENSEKRTHEGVNVLDICPAAPGGKDQQPAAFSPKTRLFYVPTNNLCMDYEALKVMLFEGAPFVGASVTMKAGPGGNRGSLLAWDAVAGKKVWELKERFPVWSGVLATAGDLVFYGTLDRMFKAVDARTGNVLFERQLDSGIVGHPMTFIGPDGKQRVAVYSGPGGFGGAIVPGKLSTDDPFAALGIVGAMTDLPQFTGPGGAVHVFKLPLGGGDDCESIRHPGAAARDGSIGDQPRTARLCRPEQSPVLEPAARRVRESHRGHHRSGYERDADLRVDAAATRVVRRTLKAGLCDLIIDLPAGYEMVLSTKPYYRSSYVFVYRRDRHLDVRSFDDPRLGGLRIGLHMAGEDGANQPPAHALARRHMVGNIVAFKMWDVDSVESPAGRIIDAVAGGDIDIAIVWGPFAGYFASRRATELQIVPVEPSVDPPSLPFAYDISMAVRPGQAAFKEEIEHILDRRRAAITEILEDYGVPLVGQRTSSPLGFE